MRCQFILHYAIPRIPRPSDNFLRISREWWERPLWLGQWRLCEYEWLTGDQK
jgi:hypothetical protein